MRVVLDENVPHELRTALTGHQVFTVAYLGWDGLENGELLTRVAAEGFDAFISLDRGLAFEHDPEDLPVAIILVPQARVRPPGFLHLFRQYSRLFPQFSRGP